MRAMYREYNYVVGYELISTYKAALLKLTALQLLIVDAFIHNWIAQRLEPYDPNNPRNSLYWFNVYAWSIIWNINETRIMAALMALTRQIKTSDGIVIQLMFYKKTSKGVYVGMNLDVIHNLVADKPERFNTQCAYWGRPELCLNIKGDTMQPLIPKELLQIDYKPLSWTESIIKEMCEFADGVEFMKGRRQVKVFNHLKNGEFRKNRKGIDRACKIIETIYSGQFWRDNMSLFADMPEEFLEFKQVEKAKKKLMALKGNKEGIKEFLLRCVKNYIEAVQPGMETYKKIKSSFPATIKDFLLFDDYKGNTVANFLIYYMDTLRAVDQNVNDIISRINKAGIPGDVLNKMSEYSDELTDSQQLSYWLNVYRLVKEVKSIIKNKETSYSIGTCFDIIFQKVDAVAAYHKELKPGYFDFAQITSGGALKELRNK